jgi:hypothetical protein
LLCSVLHSPVASSLAGPNILLSALFSNTHSHTISKIIVLYNLNFTLFDSWHANHSKHSEN